MKQVLFFLINTKLYIAFILFFFSVAGLANLEDSSTNRDTFAKEQLKPQLDSTDNDKKSDGNKASDSVLSNSFENPKPNSNKANPVAEIQNLNRFFKNNSPLKIHNTALDLLKNNNRLPAVLLLKKNFYQNLFPASYLTLNQLEEQVSFSFIFLLIGLIITSFSSFIFFILYLKNSSSLFLSPLLSSLAVFFLLLAGNLFLVKNKVSPLTEVHLKLVPMESAPDTVQTSPLTELVVLKKTEKWLKIKNPQKETGWVLKQQVFQIF